MAQPNDWIQCTECDEEFSVISSVSNQISHCPFCGEYLSEEFDDLDPDDLDS